MQRASDRGRDRDQKGLDKFGAHVGLAKTSHNRCRDDEEGKNRQQCHIREIAGEGESIMIDTNSSALENDEGPADRTFVGQIFAGSLGGLPGLALFLTPGFG